MMVAPVVVSPLMDSNKKPRVKQHMLIDSAKRGQITNGKAAKKQATNQAKPTKASTSRLRRSSSCSPCSPRGTSPTLSRTNPAIPAAATPESSKATEASLGGVGSGRLRHLFRLFWTQDPKIKKPPERGGHHGQAHQGDHVCQRPKYLFGSQAGDPLSRKVDGISSSNSERPTTNS